MNPHDEVLVVVVETGQNALEERTQTHEELLFELEDVVLNQVKEGALDLEVSILVKVVQVADEETHVGAEDGRISLINDRGIRVRIYHLAMILSR